MLLFKSFQQELGLSLEVGPADGEAPVKSFSTVSLLGGFLSR